MIPRLPGSTRTDTLLPYTTLCRSLPKPVLEALEETNDHLLKSGVLPPLRVLSTRATARAPAPAPREAYREPEPAPRDAMRPGESYAPNARAMFVPLHAMLRSEARRLVKECVRTCRSRRLQTHKQKQKQ